MQHRIIPKTPCFGKGDNLTTIFVPKGYAVLKGRAAVLLRLGADLGATVVSDDIHYCYVIDDGMKKMMTAGDGFCLTRSVVDVPTVETIPIQPTLTTTTIEKETT